MLTQEQTEYVAVEAVGAMAPEQDLAVSVVYDLTPERCGLLAIPADTYAGTNTDTTWGERLNALVMAVQLAGPVPMPADAQVDALAVCVRGRGAIQHIDESGVEVLATAFVIVVTVSGPPPTPYIRAAVQTTTDHGTAPMFHLPEPPAELRPLFEIASHLYLAMRKP